MTRNLEARIAAAEVAAPVPPEPPIDKAAAWEHLITGIEIVFRLPRGSIPRTPEAAWAAGHASGMMAIADAIGLDGREFMAALKSDKGIEAIWAATEAKQTPAYLAVMALIRPDGVSGA